MLKESITTLQASSNINESQSKKRCVKINLFNKNKTLITAYKDLLPTWMICNNAMWMAHSTVNPLQDPQALSALMAQYAYLRNNLQNIRNICRQVQHKQSTLTAEQREKYVQQHCTHLNQLEHLRQSLTEFKCRAQQITGPRLLLLQSRRSRYNVRFNPTTDIHVFDDQPPQSRSTTRMKFNPITRTHVFDDQPAISGDSILSSISILGLIITVDTFATTGEVPYGWLGLTCCSSLAIQLQRYIQQHDPDNWLSQPIL